MVRNYNIWKVLLSEGPAGPIVDLSGAGIRREQVGNEQRIFLDLPGEQHLLLAVDYNGRVRVNTPTALRYPVYSRIVGKRVVLTNMASLAMESGDELGVKTFVFLRHLAGLPYPEENFFSDIELLEASAAYEIGQGELVYKNSLLRGGNSMGKDDPIEFIVEVMRNQLSGGRPIAVLLSGGYDSRLNLALARHISRQFGNEVRLFHEFKDDREYRIAQAVADQVGIPLATKTRVEFADANRCVFQERELIDLQSGFYRDNLIRWHKYLANIEKEMPGCLILGLGAEAHKGKFYKQIFSVENDSERVLGTHAGAVREIARHLGLGVSPDSQSNFFAKLVGRALEFDDLTGQIDFLHYQTYICNGYGKRCHELYQSFGMAFPFLRPEFLKMVFAMPREKKEGFEIVKSAMLRLDPKLMEIPFTSANEKSLSTMRGGRFAKLRHDAHHVAGMWRRRILPVRKKGRQQLSHAEETLLSSIRPASDVTRLLLNLAQDNWAQVPWVRLDYVVQGLLYLNHCENSIGVKFRFNE